MSVVYNMFMCDACTYIVYSYLLLHCTYLVVMISKRHFFALYIYTHSYLVHNIGTYTYDLPIYICRAIETPKL